MDAAFKSVRLRMGGSLQDQIFYKVGNSKDVARCQELKKDQNGRFGFGDGCLTMERWDQLSHFFNNTGTVLTFGLNALNGRRLVGKDLYVGDWDPTNAHDLINYSLSRGYKVESWELGNELSAEGVSGRVTGTQYGKDMIVLKKIITQLYEKYNKTSEMPKILAPGGFFDPEWFADMFKASGLGVVDVATHHNYHLGAGVDPTLFEKMQDPYVLSTIAQTYSDVEQTLKKFGPWASAWVGESGGAYNSGGRLVSHAFVNGFWYLNELGMTSSLNHKAFCRQALIGGNYAILNTTNFIPNPDYYNALLFHRLMGTGVLETTHSGSPFLRAYTHCSRDKVGVTMLLINLSNSTGIDIKIASDMNLYPPRLEKYAEEMMTGEREEYHLTAMNDDLKSTVMLLNGVPLNLTSDGEIPEMFPFIADASSPFHVAPSSIAFIKLKEFRAPACDS
ncbi:heparanase-like protein 2 [Dioscorea cayenensis subsp. rotundata]|uniref:Heparanase-like protein 2 n=1 Tax=Dioscorea cayennensis subsp. rotundata TaxID=55577 RepID=A0AB40CA82_DIOCR|nr:heparanase-like protein 2 [Dioscorea cayenensis subsp. rotundata]